VTTVLEADGLAKRFGGVRAVDGVSFSVAAGELVALIGPNGAGKTTCFNMLMGQLRPDAGRVVALGSDVTGLAAAADLAARRRPHLPDHPDLPVLHRARERAGGPPLPPPPAPRLLPAAGALYRDEAEALLGHVGMATLADQPCALLAYGDLKRVELAMALANRPRLLLMDEPTAGWRPGSART
jgi:branched-chain amino acid transport system ATP-binding protein